MKLTYKNNNQIFVQHQDDLEDMLVFPYLGVKALDEIPWIANCFTTRAGGVSTGVLSTLNLSYSRGDDPANVDENYRRVAMAMGTTMDKVVTSDQTHTTNVRLVDASDAGRGTTRDRGYTDVDGLITNTPGLLLATFYADCVPLYFVDPVHKAIGLSHSGWRGTVNRMGQKTLEAMAQAFGTDPKDVIAAVGPSICQDCYEVSDDVAEEFMKAFPGHEDEILIDKHNGHQQLDLWKANEIVLKDAGILEEHLSVTNLCTCENPHLLFSHRASHGKRGNLGAFLMIREDQ